MAVVVVGEGWADADGSGAVAERVDEGGVIIARGLLDAGRAVAVADVADTVVPDGAAWLLQEVQAAAASSRIPAALVR